MAQAGLVCSRGHSSVKQTVGTLDNVVPIECGARIYLVLLNMKMAKNTLVCFKNIFRQLAGDNRAMGISWVITFNLRKDLAQCSG